MVGHTLVSANKRVSVWESVKKSVASVSLNRIIDWDVFFITFFYVNIPDFVVCISNLIRIDLIPVIVGFSFYGFSL